MTSHVGTYNYAKYLDLCLQIYVVSSPFDANQNG